MTPPRSPFPRAAGLAVLGLAGAALLSLPRPAASSHGPAAPIYAPTAAGTRQTAPAHPTGASARLAATRSSVPSRRIVLTPADAPAIKRAIAAQKGRVVLVNFWATWCGPCVAEFPHLVTLDKKYRRDGLTVIAVSSDMYQDRAKVVKFLHSHRAYFRHFLVHGQDPDAFIDAFDPRWRGDLPQTFIYDRAGGLVRKLSGEQTLAEFTAAVRPLLHK